MLPRILERLDAPALFFLDAHYSGAGTARAGSDTPVEAELRAILRHPVRGHVVLVDDARLFGLDPEYPTIARVLRLIADERPDCDVDVAFDMIRIAPRRQAPAPPVAAPTVPPAAGGDPRPSLPATPSDPAVTLEALRQAGLWKEGRPLRLHLGCGEQHLDGYVNLDLPPAPGSLMRTAADAFASVTDLRFPQDAVDEVRSHHVFEHFPRVAAMALLVRWHEWLRVGGRLVVETPDLEGSARTMLSSQPLAVKMGVARHLAGDQAEPWAFHVDHWFPERFRHTLAALGYRDIDVRQESWAHPPFLSNVVVTARKAESLPRSLLLERADALLAESTVSGSERTLAESWARQLREALAEGAPVADPARPRAAAGDVVAEVIGLGSRAPMQEIADFNQRQRDRWVARMAEGVPAGAAVLDVGAGTCPYRDLFAHCRYTAHDFKAYDGVKLGGTREYGAIEVVSDAESIPLPEASQDVILCTEVLEHVPHPESVVREMARLLRPGGRLLLTAPLGSGLHQLPFHFYGGFTPEWYRRACAEAGLVLIHVEANGGFFRLMAQETVRAGALLEQHAASLGASPALVALLRDALPRLFFALDERIPNAQFTVGYLVEAAKPPC